MRNQLVYDLPTRMFHWLFAGLFVTAFLIAKTVDDESPTFSYHMLAGLLLGFTVLLRILWGVVGTKHSKFSSFSLHPKNLVAYFSGILSGDKQRWVGHNPASSWATIAMLCFALGLGLTGYLMASGQKETFEDFHELLANGFLVTVLMHIAGVVVHALRHRDGIAMAMIDGKKRDVPVAEVISNSRPGLALLFVGLVFLFATHLVGNFDSLNRTLNFFGAKLQLGENKKAEKAEKSGQEGIQRSDDANENSQNSENENGENGESGDDD
jgi:cytochrome b